MNDGCFICLLLELRVLSVVGVQFASSVTCWLEHGRGIRVCLATVFDVA